MTEPDLRSLLLSAAPAARTPDPVGLVRRRLSRRRRAGATGLVAVAVAVVAGVLALVALPHHADRPDGLVAVVPSAEAEPVAVVPFVRRPYPPFGSGAHPDPTEPDCASQSLQAHATTTPDPRPDARGVQLRVELANTGPSACQVPFGDVVQLQAPDGTVVQQGLLGTARTVLGRVPPALPVGGTAVLTGSWTAGCDLPAEQPLTVVLLLRGSTDDSATVVGDDLPKDAVVPGCPPDDDVVDLAGGLSLYDLVVLDAQLRRVDDPTLSLTAALTGVPARVEQDRQLEFGVRLTNPTQGPVGLDTPDCPLFAVTLNRPGRSATPVVDGALNCEDAPAEVPAGRSVVFRLAFDVPGEAYATGPWTLTWTRTDGGGAPLTTDLDVVPAGGAAGLAPCAARAGFDTGTASGPERSATPAEAAAAYHDRQAQYDVLVAVPADGYDVRTSSDGTSARLRADDVELDAVRDDRGWRITRVRACR